MTVEWRVMAGLGLFLLPWAVVYAVTSDEAAGSAALFSVVAALLFLGLYLLTRSWQVGSRPEDRPDADPGEGAGDVGWFPTRSPWPVVMAAGATVVAFGLAFTAWLTVAGVAILLVATVGYAHEAQRAG